jgi:hypothetical protein
MIEKFPCPICDEPLAASSMKRHARDFHAVELKDKHIPHTTMELKILKVLTIRAMDRDQLVKRLKTPRSTIYDSLKKLLRRGEVDQERRNIGIGRPREMFYRPGITSWDGNLDTRL